MIKVADILPNEAMVLALKKLPPGVGERDDMHIVLADRGEEYPDRYVTWLCWGETGDCFDGHYCLSITDAANDFERRG